MKRIALVIIGHFKPEWNNLSEEEQAAFAARVGRTARKAGVTPMVGYKLTTQGSFLQIYEADDKQTLERFMGALDALGYKKYYDQALMLGERSEHWVAAEPELLRPSDKALGTHAPSVRRNQNSKPRGEASPAAPTELEASGTTAAERSSRKKTETPKKTR